MVDALSRTNFGSGVFNMVWKMAIGSTFFFFADVASEFDDVFDGL